MKGKRMFKKILILKLVAGILVLAFLPTILSVLLSFIEFIFPIMSSFMESLSKIVFPAMDSMLSKTRGVH